MDLAYYQVLLIVVIGMNRKRIFASVGIPFSIVDELRVACHKTYEYGRKTHLYPTPPELDHVQVLRSSFSTNNIHTIFKTKVYPHLDSQPKIG